MQILAQYMPMQPLEQLPGEDTRPAKPEQPLVRPPVPETGGPSGPEPTRYGDWERRGRCIDF